MSEVTVVEALRPRAEIVASILAPRITNPGPGEWEGYTIDERLEGALETIDTIRYWRPSRPDAKLHMGFLEMTDIQEESRVTTLIGGVKTEHERSVVKFTKPVKYKKTLSHSWSKSGTNTKTISFGEAAKQAWEVAAKASIEASYGGIKGALEVSGKYGRELSQQKSQSETNSETESRTNAESEEMEFTGPIEFTYDASRSIQHESAVIKARCDFEFKLYFTDTKSPFAWEWRTFRGVFIPAAKGLSPENTDYSIFAGSSPSYEMFRDAPVSDKEIEMLMRPSDKVIEFVVEYDSVTSDTLTLV